MNGPAGMMLGLYIPLTAEQERKLLTNRWIRGEKERI
jgi:hypothetical protein